ncbi:hypothetical protein IMZ48_21445 [Candidatus Bathyarchaeota archaeon]|nr:hypothetical protein [Candidatus Bathyarchaeota archaeon]
MRTCPAIDFLASSQRHTTRGAAHPRTTPHTQPPSPPPFPAFLYLVMAEEEHAVEQLADPGRTVVYCGGTSCTPVAPGASLLVAMLWLTSVRF